MAAAGIQCIDQNGDFLARGYQNGARISSNSWGASDAGGYNIISSIVDNYVWQHKDYLVLYAAGNAGPGSQTIGSPGTAKNVLTIGASENNRPDLNERVWVTTPTRWQNSPAEVPQPMAVLNPMLSHRAHGFFR